MTKKKPVKFYDVFKLGIEVEGEFHNEIESDTLRCFGIVPDESLESRSGGFTMELVSEIIREQKQENAMIRELRGLESGQGNKRRFAFANSTAGTHVHFSFSDEMERELMALVGVPCDYYLHIFDSVEFERYFFKKYFATFKLEKFLTRLRNNYCKTFIPYNGGQGICNDENLANIEHIKGSNRDRYYWLNTVCLHRRCGLELRVFPYVMTAQGAQEIIKFTRDTLLKYWKLKKTQKKLSIIRQFFKLYNLYDLQLTELSKYNKVLYNALRGSRGIRYVSMDYMEFYVYLFTKNRKAFTLQVQAQAQQQQVNVEGVTATNPF